MTSVAEVCADSPVPDSAQAPLVYLIAGEPSGDQLGWRLMRALRERTQGQVRFAGIGGPRMGAEGLQSLFPIDELAVMGILEVVPHIWRIYRRIRQTVAAIHAARPAIVVTIDAPSFSFEVCQRLHGQGVPLVHFVAPQVWAWKAYRAKKVASYLDHLLTLLPFEPPYFEVHGLRTSFVGHPVTEVRVEAADGVEFRQRHGIAPEDQLLCVLPGSRRGEVRRLMPVFGAALARLEKRYPELRVVVPTLPSLQHELRDAAADLSPAPILVTDFADKQAAYAASNVAVAASGTVAIELAVAGVPAVIAYRTNALTAQIAKRFLTLRYVSLPNILLDRRILPELLQWDCTPDKIVQEVDRLLSDPEARGLQTSGFSEVVEMLSPPGATPSQRAAGIICDMMHPGGRPL